MKNILIGLGATFVVTVALIWVVGPKQQTSATISGGPSQLAAPETSFDFGTISMAKGKVTHDFTFTNTGTGNVEVNKVFTSCMCTQVFLLVNGKTDGPFGMPGMGTLMRVSETVAPGTAGTMRVVFDPAAHGPAGVGTIDRVVTAQTDDGAALEFKFHAVVTP